MKTIFTLLFPLLACLGTAQAQAYPEPARRKGYSVLALGQTLKTAVAEDGIYKIGYEDLARHGLLSQPVPSYKIALYGNAAGMLPFFNTEGIPDDLSPLPVQMHDGGDDRFGPGDYFLFYGQSPHRWHYDASDDDFSYTRHYFCDSSFYFVSINAEMEHRVASSPGTESDGERLTWFPERIRHENDLTNLCNGGLDWLGEVFSFSGNHLGLALSTPDPVNGMDGKLHVASGAKTTGGTATFRMQFNQKTLTLFHPGIAEGTAYSAADQAARVQVTSNTSMLDISFSKTGSTGNGYLDYVSLIYPRHLRLNGAALFFRHPEAMEQSVRFSLEAAAGTRIWDITDIYHIASIPTRPENGRLVFGTRPDNTLHEYVAFNPDACPSPAFKGLVKPQNLHQLENADYVVVTHPLFLEQAQEVARLHRERDGYSVCVATTEEVYNEFSSGAKDPSAIRLFLRHLDKRSDSAHRPRYLLLFGATSFDYKNVDGLTDFVPTLQSKGRSNEGGNDPLEDIFGYLADEAGIDPANLKARGSLQVAIGRLPVRTVQEARDMVRKIDIYSARHHVFDPDQPDLSGNFGNWRNEVAFVTDDGFEDNMEGSILSGDHIRKNLPYIHLNKLYSDAYERSSSSTSTKVPALENALRGMVENGCLFLGYEGHSGWDAWSDEKILTNNIINNWKTSYTFPVIFASSCTFAYFDQTDKVSGAEHSVLKPHGGAIATIASSRTAFTGKIESIQRCFAERFIDKTDGKRPTIGSAFLYAKNAATLTSDCQKFILLGDPGLKAALPEHDIQTLHINGKPATDKDADTLKALAPVTVEGRIVDRAGDPMNRFHGKLIVKVYDKAVVKKTLGLYNSRRTSDNKYNPQVSYTDQNSLIFQGETEVKDGMFSFSFIVPKDIQYNYGNGRISYYAYNDSTDANGSFDGIIVGGMNPEAVIDTGAPVVDLYIGKKTFSGGTVGSEPNLFAEISDEYGINTTGAGIGHDMTLIIDNDYKNAIVVNNFFRYKTGSYKTGTLSYPLDLSPGKHTARLKVWNINNVSATKEITFDINDSDKLRIFDLKVVPNPARGDYADFYFNHNSKNGGIRKCRLEVFNLQGARIASFTYDISDVSGYTVGPLRWNLCGNGNKRVQAGMYFCHIKAVDGQGHTVRQGIKLVVVD